MNFDLKNLLAETASASLRTKVLALVAVASVVGLLSLAGLAARQPHFVTLYSGLGDAERVAVERALAEGQVRYRVSNFPGPYTIYVDEGQFDSAQIQVALAQALKRAPTGINTDAAGASTIFMSSGERAQNMLKREWQETEHLLTQFDFVERATVTTSVPDPSALRKKAPVTVSVALKLRGDGHLSNEQAENVARLVRFRFGVPPENVVVTDQSGRTVHDPAGQGGDAEQRRLLDHGGEYDRELAQKVNETLERAFGPDKAYVTVTSEWDTDQSTTVSESLDGEPRELEVTKTASRTPVGGGAAPAGGIPGASSNAAQGFGIENAAVGSEPSVAESESTTTDERTLYTVPRSRTQTVRTLPQLARLNVGLVLDASLEAKRDEIRTLVAAAVGLDEKRKDVLGVSVVDLAAARPQPAEVAGDAADAIPPGSEAPSPTLDLV
ncbi:MAG TPA: flagellar M-ring protein FliF C-terminal domain-containing protein, partial [Planctomycetota bacterium]|nr:flagellar M-ring protein FliF C-terminal domain-containing protein [Planctomycetota bacterium]